MTQSNYSKTYEVHWSNLDPNRHMRHSVYLDYATQMRVALFSDHGLPMDKVAKLGLGPILFREEIKYLREVKGMEKVTVFVNWTGCTKTALAGASSTARSKTEIRRYAELTVDGAWLDLEAHKLGKPSDKLIEIMKQFPRTEDFEWKS